eukprot:TRINITY_DN31687_c0_g1_i1.p1 TRINITY_DN31687_c0_g1~~TRINITY_DN31687_c0_g1_i1.p1  ORF type:complete len:156 (+),score=9.91 TRINITY_DN31687_c0_g1_i1:19-486(+)
MSDIEELELIDPTETYVKKSITVDKRKIIFCLTLGVVVLILILSVTLIPKEGVKYPNNDEITNYMEQFSIKFPEFTQITSIGKSTNSQEILVISIEEDDTKLRKELVWVVCGIHAREWTSPLSCIHFISKILEALDQEEDHVFKTFRFKIYQWQT